MYDDYYYGSMVDDMISGVMFFVVLLLILAVVLIVAQWKIFKKANRPGWAAIVPFYHSYVLYDIVWGSGIKFLLLLIPTYNVVLATETKLRLAKVFGKSTGFGVGLALLSPIFMMVLGFGEAKYVGTDAAVGQKEPADANAADTMEDVTAVTDMAEQAPEEPVQEFAEPEVPTQEEKKQQTEVPQKKVLFCSQCGAKLEGGKFCPKCGSPVKK